MLSQNTTQKTTKDWATQILIKATAEWVVDLGEYLCTAK
jgi:hypothetical protein